MNDTIQNPNALNPSGSAANSEFKIHNSELPPPAAPPGRPLTRLSVLSERQLEHVHAWIKECVPSRRISELCRTEFQKEIPHMTFVRYAHRFEPFRHLHGLTESKEAAAEISQYAATGNPSFSTNTLELLEQQAFDLALAHNRDCDAADLHILEKLWTLIHKAKNTQIRERHASVQEQKIALRREELELKRQLAAARLNNNNNGGTRSPSPTSTSRDAAPQTDATEADQKPNTTTPNPVNHVNPVQNSALSTLNPQLSTTKTPLLVVSPNPLPPEIVEENRRYAEKLRTGKIIFDESGPYIRDIELPDDPATTPSVASSSAQPGTQSSAPSATTNP
jgi:hypothetical protein